MDISILDITGIIKKESLVLDGNAWNYLTVFKLFCWGYCKMCWKYEIKFGGSTCSWQVISLTKQKQNLNNFKIKVYYSAGILYQGTHNVVVVVVVFAFGVRRNGNVFARQRGASQVLVGKGTAQ